MENIQTLTHATERDIDLLLVEEFKCNSRFTRQFISKVAGSSLEYISTNVLHSKRRTYNRREIDICLELIGKGYSKSYILIENKLDTSEQDKQGESYLEECELLSRQANTNKALSVLVCPEQYRQSNITFAGKFNNVVTYEALREFLQTFANQSSDRELADRLFYRAELIGQAINKQRRGYTAVIRTEIGDFNKKYVSLCRKTAPALKLGTSMLKEGNPSESKTMIFDSNNLPTASYLPQMRLVHQLREGNANINFYGWGNHFEKVASIIKQDISNTDLKVAATINRRKGGNSGLMIYMDTPKVDNLRAFDEQVNALRQGIQKVELLRKWFAENQSITEKWAKIVNV